MSWCIICDAGMRGRNYAEESFAATGIPSNTSRGDQGPCKDWQRPRCFQELLLSNIFMTTRSRDSFECAWDCLWCRPLSLNISIILLWQYILVSHEKITQIEKKPKICSLSFLLCETFLSTTAVIEENIYNLVCRAGKWRREGIVSMSCSQSLSTKACVLSSATIRITTVTKPTRYNYTHFFHKDIFSRNIEAEICRILRIF